MESLVTHTSSYLNNEEGTFFEKEEIYEIVVKSTECDTKSMDINQEVSLYF